MSNAHSTLLSARDLRQVLKGVIVATKAPEDAAQLLLDWLNVVIINGVRRDSGADSGLVQDDITLDFDAWLAKSHRANWSTEARQLMEIVLGVTMLRQTSRQGGETSPEQIETIWTLIYAALTESAESRLTFVATRGAQGFFAVPLCSLIEDGNIRELIRFHTWLPDGERGVKDIAVHAHQPFAESFLLAGVAADHTYDAETTQDPSLATHAEYALEWRDSNKPGSGKQYNTHRTSSTIVSTGKLVCVSKSRSRVHHRNMKYNVPAGVLHYSDVPAHRFHSTLFFFDAQRGFIPDAGVVGPKDGDEYTTFRDPSAISARSLAQMANGVRQWESDRPQRSLRDEEDPFVMQHYQSLCGVARA